MKKSTISVAVAVALLSMSAAQAGEFTGPWIGGKVGTNRTTLTGVNKRYATPLGVEGGYNWALSSTLLGLYGYANHNTQLPHFPGPVTYGSRDYGLGAKLGIPVNNWLLYGKLGYGHTKGRGAPVASAISSSAIHYGVGVEYKVAPHFSLTAEYTHGSGKNTTTKLTNNNFTFGLNYYFDSPPQPAPEPVAKAEPAPAPAAAPAPEPQPKEVWKVIMEEKPVVIEGANFDFDSSRLKPSADAKLQQVVDFAAKYPEANMEVTGHTDNIGSAAYNMKLSEKRAAVVKASLVKKGVASDRIATKGYGATKPIADNKTKAGRATNRRAEVHYTIREEKKVLVKP